MSETYTLSKKKNGDGTWYLTQIGGKSSGSQFCRFFSCPICGPQSRDTEKSEMERGSFTPSSVSALLPCMESVT